MIFRLLFVSVVCLLSSLSAASSLTWFTTYRAALVRSQGENKPLLLFFTGSDWSGWSMKMKKEILDAPDFADTIASQFICVQIDFPQHCSLPKEEREQNQCLKERLDVTEYPRLIIMDPSEREIARLGYCAESGEKFGEDLVQIIARDHHLTQVMSRLATATYKGSELQTFYEEAQSLQRTKDADTLLEIGLKCDDPLFFLLEKYRLLVEEGKSQDEEALSLHQRLMKSDPDNRRGIQFSLALIHFQELASQDFGVANPKEVIKPLEEYLDRYGHSDQENVWRVEMMIAQFYLDVDECKTALQHAETAYQAAPLDRKGEVKKSLDYIRKQADCLVEADSSK